MSTVITAAVKGRSTLKGIQRSGKRPMTAYSVSAAASAQRVKRLSMAELLDQAPYPEWAGKGYYDIDGVWTFSRTSVVAIYQLRADVLTALATVSSEHEGVFTASFINRLIDKLAWETGGYRVAENVHKALFSSYFTQGDLVRVHKPVGNGPRAGAVPNIALRK
jgi:hypothetical protein